MLLSRVRLAAFSICLLFWQAGLAPLAHAAVFHSSPGMAASSHSASHAAAAVQVEAAPCHGESLHEAPVVAQGHAGHEIPMAAVAEQTRSTAPDCCDSLACQCACVHASLGVVALALVLPLIPDHPASLGTDTPALAARTAELFRPPI